MSQWSLRLANQILGIKSPSRVWITPWEAPELRNAARRVRRLIRRYWFELLFRPDEPIAVAVKQVMASPPRTEKPRIYQQMRALLDAGAIELKPGIADELMKQYGVRLEEENGSE